MWNKTIRDRAVYLRKEGLSLNNIVGLIAVPKITVYGWIRGIEKPDRLSRLGRRELMKLVQPLGIRGIRRKRELELLKIRKSVLDEMPDYEPLLGKMYYRSLLAMLYWAEGAKTKGNSDRAQLSFANTSPQMCKLFLELLRKSYEIEEKKIRVKLHLHYYHDPENMKMFWSELLRIPLSQFAKIHLKRKAPSRFRANHHGICFIRYGSVDLQYRITTTALAIQERIIPRLAPVA